MDYIPNNHLISQSRRSTKQLRIGWYLAQDTNTLGARTRSSDMDPCIIPLAHKRSLVYF